MFVLSLAVSLFEVTRKNSTCSFPGTEKRYQYNTNCPLPRRSSRLVQHCIVLRRAGRVDEDCRGAKVKCRCHCSRQQSRCCHRRASLAAPTKR